MRIIYNRNKNYIQIKTLTLLILAAFFNDSMLIYVKAVLGNLFGYNGFVNAFIPGLFVILLLFSLKQIFGYVRIQDVLFAVVFLLVLGVSYVIYPVNREFYNEYNMDLLFTQAIPGFFLGICVCFDKKLLKSMTVLSWIAILVNFLYVFYFMLTRDMAKDAMGWAYTALLPTMISIVGVFDTGNKKSAIISLLFSLLGILYIIAMGTRGPILIALVFFAIMLWHKSAKKIGLKLFLFVLLIFLAVVFASESYIVFLEKLSDLLVENGLSSRTLDIFLAGKFITHTSGRDAIYQTLFEQLKARPFIGYGVFGEWQFVEYSAHNIWLQLCMHFGYVLGSGLLLTHMGITIHALRKSKNPVAVSMLILFACFAYGRGIFGGDYLYFEFMLLLGLSLHEIRWAKKMRVKYS